MKLLSPEILKIKPIHTCCLIQIPLTEPIKNSPIVIPDSVKQKEIEQSTHGYLVSTGQNAFCECDDIKPLIYRPIIGDRISFVKYRGTVLSIPPWLTEYCEGCELRIVQDKEIYNFIRWEDLPKEHAPELLDSVKQFRQDILNEVDQCQKPQA